MKTIVNTIPGYRVCEYALVLNPHEDLRNRITRLKEEFAAEFGTGPVVGTPRISLVRFRQYAMMEEKIVARLRELAMGFPPFRVELKDFGSFPAHTIFIQVTSKLPVQHLVKSVRSAAQRLMKMNEDNKPHFILEPHVTFAARLKPGQYEKGWLALSHKHFSGRFIAGGMTLLRKKENDIRFHAAGQFEFLHLPVITRQGELF
ncbi:MAG: 2'-5' RNA ligase family protein [Chitinophagaceae bacterium]